MKKCYHFYFSGIVQGVGFRFTAIELARRHRIKGWAANLADGRVELIAQGSEQDLELFLFELKGRFKAQISDYQKEESDYSDEYKSFQAR